jgi:hypothetical protein
MKHIGLYLMLSAITLVMMDILTLGNALVFEQQDPRVHIAATAVLVFAIILFFTGMIRSIRGVRKSEEFKIHKENIVKEIIEGERCTTTEKTLRIIIALLLCIRIIAVSVLMPFIGIFISIPYIVLALYLFFGRRHHPIFHTLLLLPAIYFYFFINENFFQYYTLAKLSIIPGFDDRSSLFLALFFGVLSAGGKFLFMLMACWLLVGDFLAKMKDQTFRRFRGLANFGTFLFLTILLLCIPLLHQPQVHFGEDTSGGTGGDGASHFAMNNTSTHMSFDTNTNQYIFTAMLKNGTDQTGPIIRIVIDGKDANISPNNKEMTIENSTIENGIISVPSGQTGTLKISSEKPFYCVTLLEKDFKYGTCFLK